VAILGKRKRILFGALQALLLAFGAFCMYYRATLTGTLAIFGALVLMRKTRHAMVPPATGSRQFPAVTKWQWQVGAALLAALLLVGTWVLYGAAKNYSNLEIPHYLFLGIFVVCAVWWVWIYVQWFTRWWQSPK